MAVAIVDAGLIVGPGSSIRLSRRSNGFVADADGGFDWAVPDEEVHTFVNELERPVGTYLFGRRMHAAMALLGDG